MDVRGLGGGGLSGVTFLRDKLWKKSIVLTF